MLDSSWGEGWGDLALLTSFWQWDMVGDAWESWAKHCIFQLSQLGTMSK